MASALMSSLVPSVNVGSNCAIFTPVHEAHLEIARQNRVNLTSAILCFKIMMEWLGATHVADLIDRTLKNRFDRNGPSNPRYRWPDVYIEVYRTNCSY